MYIIVDLVLVHSICIDDCNRQRARERELESERERERESVCARAPLCVYSLVGLVVKASTSTEEDPGFESRLHREFSWSSHINDLKTGTPLATLPGARRYRVNVRTGWRGVSIL